MTADDCTNAAKPICEPTQQVCVACTADMIGACGGTTPICSSENTCTGCTSHDQCASNACLPDGSCAEESQVAYVSSSGDDSNSCTADMPCLTITNAALKGKPYIKVMTDLEEAVVLNNVNVTILGAPGVAITRPTMGPVVDLKGTSTITISGLTIRMGSGPNGLGLTVNSGEPVTLTLDRVYILGNAGIGLNVLGGSLTMTRSVVALNTGGGAKLETVYNVTNSLFVANGSPGSNVGGLEIKPGPGSRFAFNTVAQNTASSATTPYPGIFCVLPAAISNTIVSTNEVSSACEFEYSLFDANVSVSGTNRAGDPKFRNTNPANVRTADYFRIQTTSDAVDQADPAATLTDDIDGDERPQGAAPDIGADEAQ